MTRRTHLRRSSRSRLVAVAAVVVLVLSAAPPAAASSTAPDRGWAWPLQPAEVEALFDPPDGPYGPGHRGVDLRGAVAQPVIAPADGVVIHAGEIGGVGYVTLAHGDGVETTYQPLAKWAPLGARIEAGEPVAFLGWYGSHCATRLCLHWGVRVDGEYVDPLTFVDVGPPRLLPYWDVPAPRLPAGRVAPAALSTARTAAPTDGGGVAPPVALAVAAVAGVLVGLCVIAVRRRGP